MTETATPEQLDEMHDAMRSATANSIQPAGRFLPDGKFTTKPTVHEAWADVMGEVIAVRKDSRNASQGFNFRGIDSVMNAVGPALRKHGVYIVPEEVEISYRDTTTTQGKSTRETTCKVRYRATGPSGDSFRFIGVGESLDQGDKGTAKAMSVAYRVALLQALTIPTDEPDPDMQTYERSNEPVKTPADRLRDEILEIATDRRLSIAEIREDFESWSLSQVGKKVDFDTAPESGLTRYKAYLQKPPAKAEEVPAEGTA